MSPYGTRPSNANAHPGQILLAADGARKRRSSEEMIQARLQKEEQARTLQQKEAALLQRIAELEAQSRALESQSVGPSALPAKVKNINTAKGSKASVKTATENTSQTPLASRKGGAKLRRADVAKVMVGDTEAEGFEDSGVRRKRKNDSIPPATSNSALSAKRSKATNPSGLLVAYQPPPHPKPTGCVDNSNSTPTTEDTGIKYGGYIDSDDDDELPELISDSRVTTEGIVKIENDAPAVLQNIAAQVVSAVKTSSRSTRYTMRDIDNLFPSHLRYIWGGSFVPETLSYVGGRLDPWNTSGVNWTDFLKSLWEETMPYTEAYGVPPTHPQSPVFTVTMQRISEWRNGISKYAVEVVNDHFRAEEMTETEISRFVTTQLGRGLPFVSLQTSFDPVSGIAIREGRFQGPLVLRTLSYHLKRTGKLAREFRDTPDGALGLATVAVERALSKYKTGVLSVLKNRKGHVIDAFSYKIWGLKTDQYIDSIANLSESEWAGVLTGAEAYLGTSAGRVSSDDSDDDDNDNDNNASTVFESGSERAKI